MQNGLAASAFLIAHRCAFGQNNAQTSNRQAIALSAHQSDDPDAKSGVVVVFGWQNGRLALSYFLRNPPPAWRLPMDFAHTRADFLWQEDCLECFVAYANQKGYFELNLTPDGRYNLYRFDAYRLPDAIPPRPAALDSIRLLPAPCVVQNHTNALQNWRSWHVCLQAAAAFGDLARVHPCAIVYRDGAPTYYAAKHADPPDFHCQKHWIAAFCPKNKKIAKITFLRFFYGDLLNQSFNAK